MLPAISGPAHSGCEISSLTNQQKQCSFMHITSSPRACRAPAPALTKSSLQIHLPLLCGIQWLKPHTKRCWDAGSRCVPVTKRRGAPHRRSFGHARPCRPPGRAESEGGKRPRPYRPFSGQPCLLASHITAGTPRPRRRGGRRGAAPFPVPHLAGAGLPAPCWGLRGVLERPAWSRGPPGRQRAAITDGAAPPR